MKCIDCDKSVEIINENNREKYVCSKGHKNKRMIDHESVTSYSEGGEVVHKSVGAIIKCKEKILLLKRVKYPYSFTIPAGHIEETDKNPKEAVLREIEEETGIITDSENLSEVFSGKIKDPCRRGADYHNWELYMVNLDKEKEAETNAEANLAKWVSKGQLTDLEMTAPTQRFLIEENY